MTTPFLGLGRLAALDWLVVAGYLALALGVGVVMARRSRGSLENFFLSGRNLPWWLAGTSMVATSFASDTPLVVTGWTRAGGVAGNWRWWGYLVSTLLVVVLFARLWQRSGVVTDVEFMELRYSGRPARLLRGLKSLYQAVFVHCFVMGWVVLGMTKVLVVLFDLGEEPLIALGPLSLTPAWAAMLGCSLLALVYSEVSGLWGVVLTDFVQFALAMAGALVLMVIVVQAFGGLAPLADALAASPVAAPKLSSVPDAAAVTLTAPHTWNRAFWEFVVFLLVVPFATKNSDGGGVMIQRLLASKDERHAMGATLWYAVAHNALRPWPWILVALASLLVLPPLTATSPADGTVLSADAAQVVVAAADGERHVVPLPSGEVEGWAAAPRVAPGASVRAGQTLASTDDERAYPMMMRRYLPAGLLGLLVASFLAAFMSTIDSHVNVASSYLVNDFYRRFLRPDAPPGHYVRAARITGPLVLATALAFAAVSDSVRGMFDTFSTLFSGLGVVYLLRWVWWRINAWSEIAALLVGALVMGVLELWPGLAVATLPDALLEGGRAVFPGDLLIVVAVTLPVTILVTLLTPPVEHGHLRAFYLRVRPLGAWGPLRAGGPRPGRLAGSRLLLAWLGSTAFVIAATLLPGELLLAGGARAGAWILVGVTGLLLLLLLPRDRQRHDARSP